jgi:hypothetical protein
VLEGSCTATAEGCITSPNWPANYGNSESCRIAVGTDVSLVVQSFATESGYDLLTVNGVQYSGSGEGLQGLTTRAGDVLTWASDSVVHHDGWHICSGGALLRRYRVCLACKTLRHNVC